jgi:hypothetical protein
MMLDRSGGNHHLTLVNSPAESLHQSGSFPPVQTLVLNGTQYGTRALETNLQLTNFIQVAIAFKLDEVPPVGGSHYILDTGYLKIYVENYGGGNIVVWSVLFNSGGLWFASNISIASNPLGWKIYGAQITLSATIKTAINGVYNSLAAPATLAPASALTLGANAGGASPMKGRIYAAVLANNGVGDAAYNALYESVRPYFVGL